MLSVVITAWNEAHNLPRAISSVKHLADEIIVVDTESTDDTAKVAKKLGCKVYSYPRPGIVEYARNFSISKAKGDWILLLDADEEVPPELVEFIKKAISQNKYDYYRLPRKNIIFDKWIKSSHWWPDYTYRLFKVGSISWQESIHSIPITSGQGTDFPPDPEYSLVHHNYQTVSQFIDRLNRYTDFQSRELFATDPNFHWTDLISKPAQEFVSQYFARQAYKDGLHGLSLSLLQSFSMLVVYLKLWQLSGFADIDVTPDQLVSTVQKPQQDFWWWYCQTMASISSGPQKIFWKIRSRTHI